MSYDLAVWEGEQPADHDAATTTFLALYERYVNVPRDARMPPSPRLAAFVAALLERWPDLSDDPQSDSPWATGPLIREATGPFMYFAITLGREGSAGTYAARVARDHGLVCYDPQAERVLT